MAIGSSKEMIDGGAWQTYPQPHLPKSKKLYKMFYRIGFEYKGFRFIGEFLKDTETSDFVWFIYPYENEFFDILVFSDKVKQNPLWQRNIYDINLPNLTLKKLFNDTIKSYFREK